MGAWVKTYQSTGHSTCSAHYNVPGHRHSTSRVYHKHEHKHAHYMHGHMCDLGKEFAPLQSTGHSTSSACYNAYARAPQAWSYYERHMCSQTTDKSGKGDATYPWHVHESLEMWDMYGHGSEFLTHKLFFCLVFVPQVCDWHSFRCDFRKVLPLVPNAAFSTIANKKTNFFPFL